MATTSDLDYMNETEIKAEIARLPKIHYPYPYNTKTSKEFKVILIREIREWMHRNVYDSANGRLVIWAGTWASCPHIIAEELGLLRHEFTSNCYNNIEYYKV